jgi:hypothetical protein
MLVALVLLLFGGILFFGARREEKTVVHVNLSATEVAEIKSLVRTEMRRRLLPGFSWHNIIRMPAALSKELQCDILAISPNTTNFITVAVGKPVPGEPDKMTDGGYFFLEKDTNGWHLDRTAGYPDYYTVRLPAHR